ncbi:hypothetical protein BH09VER1_BH09VER1_16310 [soil metagenome]
MDYGDLGWECGEDRVMRRGKRHLLMGGVGLALLLGGGWLAAGEHEPLRDGKFHSFVVAENWPKRKLPSALMKEVRDGMTLGELVLKLGPGWMARNEGVGLIAWFFDDGSKLTVWPKSHQATDVLSFGKEGASLMWWDQNKAPW